MNASNLTRITGTSKPSVNATSANGQVAVQALVIVGTIIEGLLRYTAAREETRRLAAELEHELRKGELQLQALCEKLAYNRDFIARQADEAEAHREAIRTLMEVLMAEVRHMVDKLSELPADVSKDGHPLVAFVLEYQRQIAELARQLTPIHFSEINL